MSSIEELTEAYEAARQVIPAEKLDRQLKALTVQFRGMLATAQEDHGETGGRYQTLEQALQSGRYVCRGSMYEGAAEWPEFVRLDSGFHEFYAGKIRALSPQQRKVIEAFGHLPPPVRPQAVARCTWLPQKQVGTALATLSERGFLVRESLGQYRIADPELLLFLVSRTSGFRDAASQGMMNLEHPTAVSDYMRSLWGAKVA